MSVKPDIAEPILTRRSAVVERSDGRLAVLRRTGSREGAARLERLGIVGSALGLALLASSLLGSPLSVAPGKLWTSTALVLVSLAVIVYGHRSRPSVQVSRWALLAYATVVGFCLGLVRHQSFPLSPVGFGLPLSVVWMVLIAPLVPTQRRQLVLVCGLIVASEPLAGLVMLLVAGQPMPPVSAVLWFYGFGLLIFGLLFLVRRSLTPLLAQLGTDQLGSYQLLEKLGQGGMGEVWRARHRLLARPAAVKLIRVDSLRSERGESADRVIKRFEREAQATALLRSVHTVEIYDFGITTENGFFYVMELLDGITMEELVNTFGPVSPGRAIYLLKQVCHSLIDAHDHNLVHRDIKPANLFVCRMGAEHDFVKVLDFGLVKSLGKVGGGLSALRVTSEGAATGTPAFIAPEIVTGDTPVDARADLYSLGCVAYWLLTGRLVFDASTGTKQALAHVRAVVIPPSQRTTQTIPRELEYLIMRCLEKSPDQRPDSARVLRRELAAIELAEPWNSAQAEVWWADLDKHERERELARSERKRQHEALTPLVGPGRDAT